MYVKYVDLEAVMSCQRIQNDILNYIMVDEKSRDFFVGGHGE